jgi:hypothetical protein
LIREGQLAYRTFPSQLCYLSAKTMPTEVLQVHFRCRTQALCDVCHQEYTSDRASARAKGKKVAMAAMLRASREKQQAEVLRIRRETRLRTGSAVPLDAPPLSRSEVGKLAIAARGHGSSQLRLVWRDTWERALAKIVDLVALDALDTERLAEVLGTYSAANMRILCHGHRISIPGQPNTAGIRAFAIPLLTKLTSEQWASPANVETVEDSEDSE